LDDNLTVVGTHSLDEVIFFSRRKVAAGEVRNVDSQEGPAAFLMEMA
jgi:hypothetical protein